MAVKQEISAYEFHQKLSALWNQTIGSEWNSRAGGFVKARVWTKEGIIRTYFGDGYLQSKQASNGEVVGSLSGFKYGIDEQVKPMVKQLLLEFRCVTLMPVPQQTVWLNEDGEEVDALDPDAVVTKKAL